jgi:hypothetical protein
MAVKDKADNPLVFILLISVAVAAVFKGGQYLGNRLGSPGLNSFFGGK